MKVLLLSRYSRLAACSRLRSMQYLPFLEQHGIDVEICSLFGDDYLHTLWEQRKHNLNVIVKSYLRRISALTGSRKYDLLWIEREMFPWFPWLLERLLQFSKTPYIIDYDDAIFHRYELHGNALVRLLYGKKIDSLMKGAAVVIAGNNYLAERAREAGANSVVLIPTVVDMNRYLRSQNQQSNTVFTIGWIGSPTTVKYIKLIENVLQKVCLTENIRLRLVGSGPVSIKGLDVDVVEWSEADEVDAVHSFDVGVMPLLDGPWERGKCGYKIIQYMACGKPVVASPVGANCDIVDEQTGILASSEDQWYQALKILIAEPLKRKKMGDNALEKVQTKYSLQVTASQLMQVFESVSK